MLAKPALSLCLLLAACSSTEPGPDAGPGGDAAPSGRDAAPDAAPTPDGGPGQPDADEPDTGPEVDAGFDLTRPASCPTTATYLVLYHGRVLDQAGMGLGGSKAQMCIRTAVTNRFLCIDPADTDANGNFTVVVPEAARCMNESTMRFLAPRTNRGATYCKIDLSTLMPEDTATVAFSMFDTRAPRTLPPLGDPLAQRTIVFDDGLEVDLVPDTFFDDYSRLSAARVPLDHPGLCFLEGEAPFDGLYVLSPEGDIEGRAAVRIPNTSALPANTRVRGYVLGSLGCTLEAGQEALREAEWAEFGRGQVSADGRTISIAPGLPCLSWFAYRAE